MKRFYLPVALLFSLFFFKPGMAHAQQNWQYYFTSSALNSLAARDNDILVCSSKDIGFVRLDTLGNATFYNVMNNGFPYNYTYRAAVDHTGDWWVVHSGGVARYDGADWVNWDTTQLGLSFYTSFSTALETSDDGRIGVGTSTRGGALYENNAWLNLNTTNSGIPSNNIRDIAFDKNGKVYFATSAGLAVRDGANWTVFNTSNSGITGLTDCKSVTVNDAGVVWVAASTNRFAKWENGVWTAYQPADIGLAGSVGFSGDVQFDAQNRLWLSYSKSISRFENGSWTHFNEAAIGCTLPLGLSSKIRLAIDGAGQLWSTACGLTKFDGQSWQNENFNNAILPTGQIFAITQDKSGNMWFAGEPGGISRKQGDQWQGFAPLTLGAKDNGVYTAHGDSLGNVWFGVSSGEILRYDGNAWTVFDTIVKALPDFASYWTVASAPDGTIWFSIVPPAAFTGHLARYRNGEWTFFTPDNAPLPNNYDIVSIITEGNSVVWFLANDRLLKYNGSNWTSFDPTAAGLPYTVLRRMSRAPDGAFWISSDKGLLRFDGANWTNLSTANSGIPNDNIYTVNFDRSGGMYVGFDPATPAANCAVLRGGVWTELLPSAFEPGFLTRPWAPIVDRDNRLWYSNWQSPGVFVYDPMLVRTGDKPAPNQTLSLFPNPVLDVVQVQIPGWENQSVQVRITDASGKCLLYATATADGGVLRIELPSGWPAGVFGIELVGETGARQTGRFVCLTKR